MGITSETHNQKFTPTEKHFHCFKILWYSCPIDLHCKSVYKLRDMSKLLSLAINSMSEMAVIIKNHAYMTFFIKIRLIFLNKLL